MPILAVDTATEVCGVALAREDGRILAELRLDRGLTHTATLLEAIHTVLEMGHTSLPRLDALAVTRGPGSFTGLRIGISTIKGLALATGRPVIGVSTLAALAHQAPESAPWICPMLDARRRQVYWSMYQRRGGELVEVQPEQVGPLQDAIDRVTEPCLFIGNGARLYRAALNEHLPHKALPAGPALDAISPGAVAQLAARRLRQGLLEDVLGFAPLYLRPSDAQVAKRPEP